ILKTTQATSGLPGPTDSGDILKVVQDRLQRLEERDEARERRVEALEKALTEANQRDNSALEASRKEHEDRDQELWELRRTLKGKHPETAPSTEAPIATHTGDVLRLA